MKRKTLMKKIAVPMAVLMAMAVAPVQAFGTTEAEPEVITDEAKATVEATEPEAAEEVATEETKGAVKLAAAAELKAAESNATAPAAITGLAYTGKAQPLVTFTNDSEAAEGAVQYQARVGNSGSWQTDPSKVTKTDAYTYTVNIQKREAYNIPWGLFEFWKWGKWTSAGSIDVTIAKAKISAAITLDEKVYDGNTDATVGPFTIANPKRIDGVNGEKVNLYTNNYPAVSGTYSDKNAGENKTVTINKSDFHLSALETNYELDSVTCTGTITKRAVAVSGIKGVDKTYDGTTDAELDFSEVPFGSVVRFPGTGIIIPGTGIITGDDLTATATGTFNDANVGSDKEITIRDLALGGTDAGNYRITIAYWAVQKTTNADITERAVSFNLTDAAKVEGETDPQLSLTFGNVLDDDQPAFAERFTVEREAGEAAGTYKIYVKDNGAGSLAFKAQAEEGIFDNYDYSAYETAEATFTITEVVVPVDDTDEYVDKDDNAKTGDNSPLLPIAGLALLAMAGAAAAFCRRKSDNE